MGRADFDVGIVGGGPAGASLGAYLARRGVSCVVLEREIFPRPHVGESLVPASTRVFRDLGFLQQMEEAGFPRKYGAAWTSTGTQRVAFHGFEQLPDDYKVNIRFAEREQEGVELPYTYHVDRGKFDLLLLQHADRMGARVLEGLQVEGVDLEADEIPRIRGRLGRKRVDFRVRIVVDASGRNTLLGRQLKLRVTDPVFDQFAIHAWFEDYDRGRSEEDNYIFIHFLPVSNSWLWQIPITDSVTSFGVVTQKKNFAKSRQSREKFFWDCIAKRPEVFEKLRRSRQIRPFKEEGDYSYAMAQVAGDRFLLIGDAGRFVDPIFSSGVSIALNSSRLAQASILTALERGDFRRQSFADYETILRRGTENWYKFITLYYRLNILFTYFLNDKRYRLDVLKLLQGDLYDEEEPPVLAKMRQTVTAVEGNCEHPWHALLGDLTANAFTNAGGPREATPSILT
jgi:1H-pyrrole-2-carbonyl-[peptidyl-carrier protein] chlorinase